MHVKQQYYSLPEVPEFTEISSTQKLQNNVYWTSKTDSQKKKRAERPAREESDSHARVAYILQAGAVPHGPRLASDAVQKGPPTGAKAYGQSAHVADSRNTGVAGLHTKLKLKIYGKLK